MYVNASIRVILIAFIAYVATVEVTWGQVRLGYEAVELNAAYTGDMVSNHTGGIRRGTVYLHNIDLSLSVDAGALMGWNGASFFVYGLGNHGGSPSELVGDAQGLNNIEAPATGKVFEAWLEQRLFHDRVSVRAGLYDVNTEFDAHETGGLFINSSHGVGPDFSQSGLNGPSIFPVTSVGVRIRWRISPRLHVQSAVLDGVPGSLDSDRGTHIRFGRDDGLLITSEVAYFSRHASEFPHSGPGHPNKIALGLWTYTGAYKDVRAHSDAYAARTHRGTYGVFALGEWPLFRETTDPLQGISVYARVGMADPRVHRFDAYMGAGAVYTGLVAGRPEDQIGLAVAAAHNGRPFMRDQPRPVETAETTVEGSYLLTLSSRLSFQLDVQYIVNPNTDPARDNSLATTMRLVVSL